MGEDPTLGDASLSTEDMQFMIQKRGYDPSQVHGFAQMVAKRLAALQVRNSELQALVDRNAQETKPADVFDRWGDETRRLFSTASETVARVTAESTEQARQTISSAEQKATALRVQTEQECAAMRAEAQLFHDTTKADAEKQSADELSAARTSSTLKIEQARQTASRITAEAHAEAATMVHEAQAEVARIETAGERARQVVDSEVTTARTTLLELRNSRAGVVANLAHLREVIGDFVTSHATVDELPDTADDHAPLSGVE